MNELPSISNCTYTSATTDGMNLMVAGNQWGQPSARAAIYNTVQPWDLTGLTHQFSQPQQESKMQNRRIVQVFIADPNENVPLDKSLLYQDEKPRLTDSTDQELFFELDIKNILSKHNEFRVTVVDKEASEGKNKDVLLEPAKIRDLKMTVVSVATF